MSPRSCHYRGLDTTEVEVPGCLRRVPSAACAALVALSSMLRHTESGGGSPSSVAVSATGSRRPSSRRFRCSLVYGPRSIATDRALTTALISGLVGCGPPRRLMARAMARSLKSRSHIRRTGSLMRPWLGRCLPGLNLIISAVSSDAAIHPTLSRLPQQRTSAEGRRREWLPILRPAAWAQIQESARERLVLFGRPGGAVPRGLLRA